VASGLAVITDTLPQGTTVVTWTSENYGLWQGSVSGNRLVLTAPAIPGQWSSRIWLRLRVGGAVALGTQLTNTVQIYTADDGDRDNNQQTRDDLWVREPRWEVNLNMQFSSGQLTPGGSVGYNIGGQNGGNMATHAWLTDTLPAGTVFQGAWLQRNDKVRVSFPPARQSGQEVVWDLGTLEPGEGRGFELRVSLPVTLAPDTEIINCAVIAGDTADSEPRNNTRCVVNTLRRAGTNLTLSMDHLWNSDRQLVYDVWLDNVGSQALPTFWVTQTYPLSATLLDVQAWGVGWQATRDEANRRVILRVDGMGVASRGQMRIWLDLDPSLAGVQGRAYTSTAEAPIMGDVYPADNSCQQVAYTGPDVYATKRLSAGVPAPGEVVTFTVEFGNRAKWPWNTDRRTGSQIVDILPRGMEFVRATQPGQPDQLWFPELIIDRNVIWGWSMMEPEYSWVFDLAVRIANTAQGGDVLTNVIRAHGDSQSDVDPLPGNNEFALPVTVRVPMRIVYLPIIRKAH
jgi:uncharacterized repeat protein (TIGR01451 family)